MPTKAGGMDGFWKQRYADINNFEQYLTNNGTVILKFFLHVSKQEQKKRLLERIEDSSKNWKFEIGDLNERELWPEYMKSYSEMLRHTSTDSAPWHIIPADKKWFMRAAVSEIILEKLKSLKLHYPEISKEQKRMLVKAKETLENEG
jgi:polyphosphate kinase 2 (PPK2 family)